MRAGDDEIVFAAQEIILQNFRQRKVKKFPVQDRFHFRIAALHRVADHDHIRVARNVFLTVTLMKFDPALFEKDRHRRINTLVRAADLEPALLQRRRDRAHGRTANANEMKFLRRGFGHADSLRREFDLRQKFDPRITRRTRIMHSNINSLLDQSLFV